VGFFGDIWCKVRNAYLEAIGSGVKVPPPPETKPPDPVSDKEDTPPPSTLPDPNKNRDAWARIILERAFAAEFGRHATLSEMQALQAIGRQESNYGKAWEKSGAHNPDGKAVGSNNWGGVQKRPVSGVVSTGNYPDNPPDCGGDGFQHLDHNAKGQPYWGCYRRYPTPEAGAQDLVKQVYVSHGRQKVLEAAATGDVVAFSSALRASGYFELALDKHIAATERSVAAIAKALNEPVALKRGGIKSGAMGASGAVVMLLVGSAITYAVARWGK
jgi:hypothetical protein